jgi:chemotaxis protein MotA
MRTVPPKIPAAYLIGAIGGLVLALIGAYIEGSPLMAFLNLPATLIVFGGTSGATLAAVGINHFMKAPAGIKMAISAAHPDWEGTAVELLHANEIARRESMIKLEEEAKKTDDPFLVQVYQLLADGVDREVMEEIMFASADKERKEITSYSEFFTKFGGFMPTLGITGTVMGLVHALGLLNEPDKLGPAIAGAFMATLYGVGVSNLFVLPLADRLGGIAREVEAYREMIIDAALCIQRGDNTRALAERMAATMPVQTTGDALREQVKLGGS